MKVVYVIGRFRAPNAWLVEQNVRRAEEAAFEIAKLGAAPLCPHTNTRFFNGTQTDSWWLEATLALMRKCDAVFAIRGWEESTGGKGEVAEAKRLGIPVFLECDARGYENLSTWIIEQG